VELLVGLIEGIARRQSALLLFEDLHWADPTTIEILGILIERTADLPLLLLLTFRPEFSQPWTARDHLTALSLNRLTRVQAARMAMHLTRNKPLPVDLVEQIVEKTDGVPLFVEELTKAVLESNIVEDQGDHYAYGGDVERLGIPATLSDSLMMRLDRLIPVKEIAQVGACLGREFSYPMLRAMVPMDEARLGDALDKLVESQLVSERGRRPDSLFIFKHALVQDTAYQAT
jgi:predicted ATPase